MRRRTFAQAASVAGLSALIASCAPSSDTNFGMDTDADSEGDGDVALKVWTWRPEDSEAYDRIFSVFEEANPGITVQCEAFQATEYNQILTTGLAGSDGPDVPMVRAYGELQPNIDAGQLLPIDDEVEGIADLDESALAGAVGREDGRTYAVPIAQHTLQMFYNKRIFAEQGLDVPTTWGQFLAVNEALAAAEITPIALGVRDDWVLPMYADIIGSARYGGAEFEERVLAGDTDFRDPDYVASLELISQLEKYLTPDVVGVGYTDSQMQFTAELAAQFPGGSFEIATFQTQAPHLDLGSFQVPPPPGSVLSRPVSPTYSDGNFAVNAKSPRRAEALTLLNWMASAEFGQLVSDELKKFSPFPGVEHNDPVMKEAWSNQQSGDPAPYLLLVDFRYGDPQGTALLGREIQNMFLGEQDAAGAAEALQSGIGGWFVPES